MGWFDEQIRQRRQRDREVFEEGMAAIAGAVLGTKLSAALNDDRQRAKDAIDEILKFYHVKSREVPDSIQDINDQLEFLLRPNGIMRRSVKLDKGWYKDAVGAMLGTRKSDGAVVALIPSGVSGYSCFDPDSGARVKINARNEDQFDAEAIAFCKPLPLKKIGIAGLLRYMMESLSIADVWMLVLSTLAVSLVGLLLPKLNQILFSTVVESASARMLFAVISFMVCVSLSSLLLSAVRELVLSRIDTRISTSVEAASMMRVLSLPASFFKKYATGDLASRTMNIQALSSLLVSSLWSTGLMSLFSLIYIAQIFSFAPSLAAPALLVIAVTLALSLITAVLQMRLSRQQMEQSAKESGLSYALITGVQKIKLAGAERRAFAKWSRLYARLAELQYRPDPILRLNGTFNLMISLAGTILIYFAAVRGGVSVSEYYAFNAAYATVSGAFMSLAGIAMTVAQIKPILHMAKPILDEVPEIAEEKQVVEKLNGSVEFSNVSFRYTEDMPNVVDNLSLKIRPGQYVAIVGKTGCGKSTLMRLLLGFETPQRGAIYYDGKDINSIDLKSLRRKIGVVMQDGKLFSGDIYSNIVISAPWLTLDDAWAAAEMAGVADDIRRMPMGMNTYITEGSGGISGGQRQRLLIARAIAPKPKILMFDEATSALDNITQRVVSESLEKLKCTRIVIAHRLSTIRQCDRIIVLEGGHIIEDGTYDELISRGGFFADLVERQRLDTGAD